MNQLNRPLCGIRTVPSIAMACILAGGCTGREAAPRVIPDAGTRAERALRLQEVSHSSPDAEFTSVTAMDVDSRGLVYVGDWYRQQLTVLNPDATVLRTLGRRGSGPGEFRSIRGVQVLPGDSILVYDPSLARVSVYAQTDSAPAYSVTLRTSGAAPFQLWRIPADSGYVALFRPTFMFSEGQAARNRRDVLRVLARDGATRTTIKEFPSKSFLVAGTSVTPNPFGREGLVAVDARGSILFIWNDSLAVDRFSPDGTQRDRIRLPMRPAPVTSSHVQRQLREWDGSTRTTFGQVLQDSAPSHWPAASAMLIDDRDRLWIALPGDPASRTEWIVLSSNMRYIASVFLPARETLRVVRNGRLYTVRMDNDDIPAIAIYRATGIPE
ncbi:hypothetical protein [Longimicrobium sp.]|uniref:hypothetical protein n=1 Tax=Longimicrobium sp. TaxID=2029185 RepID=UPI002E370EBD|nr:hypothetical protein [Longimicrobium sp.]HEX6040003.1 hypothetical protein [Longimicrobium sp.]